MKRTSYIEADNCPTRKVRRLKRKDGCGIPPQVLRIISIRRRLSQDDVGSCSLSTAFLRLFVRSFFEIPIIHFKSSKSVTIYVVYILSFSKWSLSYFSPPYSQPFLQLLHRGSLEQPPDSPQELPVVAMLSRSHQLHSTSTPPTPTPNHTPTILTSQSQIFARRFDSSRNCPRKGIFPPLHLSILSNVCNRSTVSLDTLARPPQPAAAPPATPARTTADRTQSTRITGAPPQPLKFKSPTTKPEPYPSPSAATRALLVSAVPASSVVWVCASQTAPQM